MVYVIIFQYVIICCYIPVWWLRAPLSPQVFKRPLSTMETSSSSGSTRYSPPPKPPTAGDRLLQDLSAEPPRFFSLWPASELGVCVCVCVVSSPPPSPIAALQDLSLASNPLQVSSFPYNTPLSSLIGLQLQYLASSALYHLYLASREPQLHWLTSNAILALIT